MIKMNNLKELMNKKKINGGNLKNVVDAWVIRMINEWIGGLTKIEPLYSIIHGSQSFFFTLQAQPN